MQLTTCVQAAPAVGFDAGQTRGTHAQRPALQLQSAMSYRQGVGFVGLTQRPPSLGTESGHAQRPKERFPVHVQV
jgi:hypothetical protein